MSRVLVIGDTHAPCMREDYPRFLKKVYKKYKCNKVVHIGDVVDWAAISYHEKSGALKDGDGEYRKAKKQVAKLYKAFPKLTWLTGNHDALPKRQMRTANLPHCLLKDERELWGVPGWTIIPQHGCIIIDGVMYQHGDRGKGGQYAAVKNCKEEFRSVVQGHLHAQAGVWFFANQRARVFGAQVPVGVDHEKEAQEYGKKYNQKPIIGCMVIDNGVTPHVIPMEL